MKVITQARVLCLIYTHEGVQLVKASVHMYIRQSTSACVITNMLHFQHSKNLPKLKVDCSASLYSNRY